MTQPLVQRLNYHPDPRQLTTSDRKVATRIRLIEENVDVTDKVIMDLGCSGGSFSFSLARRARRVIAIDGDAEVIARNRAIQKDLKLENIEFIHAKLDADLIEAVGPVDVTLFLSVYHHMLAISDAYDWNIGCTREAAEKLIDRVNGGASVLCFEIGYPNEGYEWCGRLPHFGDNWDEYVYRNIFKGAYRSVAALTPGIHVGWLNKHVVSRLSAPYKEDSIMIQRAKNFFGFDSRDLRKIYIGRK